MSSQTGSALKRATERRHRRHPRYRCEFPVAIILFSGNEHQRLDGHCRDLSEAGVGVLIAAELVLGEVADVAFSLPDMPRSWDLRAVLRHRRGFHYGFEFIALSDQQSKDLAAYVAGRERVDSE